MELSIKKHIINNFSKDSEEELRHAIDDAVINYDDELLPGLGVFMLLFWKNADNRLKDNITRLIVRSIKEEKEKAND